MPPSTLPKRRNRPPRNRQTKERAGKYQARVNQAQLRYMDSALASRDRRQTLAAKKGDRYRALPLSVGFFSNLNPIPYSNHALIPTKYRGKMYLSSEHAYLTLQARCYGMDKLADIWETGKGEFFCFNRWFRANNPKHVKSWSTKEFAYFRQHPEDPRRKHWTSTRDEIMFQIVKAKFEGCATARQTLLATGQAFLAELSPSDDHWGVNERITPSQLDQRVMERRPFRGNNQLGRILMAIREILRRRTLPRNTLKARTARYLAKRAMLTLNKQRSRPSLEAQVAQLEKDGHPNLNPDEMHRAMSHFSFQLVPQARKLALSTVRPQPLPAGVQLMTAARRTNKHLEGQFSFRVQEIDLSGPPQ